MRRHPWLIPLAAFLTLVPIVIAGPSDGKDYVFHLSSWLGAADQMRHGMVWPRWDFLAAYNAGEPRFVFYPPMSWMLGALLTFVLPIAAVPFAMAWIGMVIAGFSMHALARSYTTEGGALLAACMYLANPWMMFTILARCAYGELFAAAFCPWLLASALEEEPKAWQITLPLGLIWLSNIPGAILCTYLLALVLAYRLWRERRWTLLPTFGFGLGWALALDALAFVPSLVQRKYIDVDGAFPEGFRPIDNLSFFRKTASDPFFLQTQHVAVLLLVVCVGLLLVKKSALRPLLLIVAFCVAFSLTWFAKPFWLHLPAVWVIQFPWRALFVLATVAALAAGLALDRLPIWASAGMALVLAVAAVWAFHLPCGATRTPQALEREMVEMRHNSVPINEYVVVTGDSELMRPDNPPWWLAAGAGDYPVGSVARDDFDPVDAMPKLPEGLKLEATPLRFEVRAAKAEFLVINLQDYPNWVVRVNGSVAQRVARADGLTAVVVPAGSSRVEVRWRHSWDEWVGLSVSGLAWGLFPLSLWFKVSKRNDLSLDSEV